MPLGLARFLVFFSSAAVLVLEILAGRLMAPFVGVSLETFTGIIGVVLAGIAAGTSIGGRIADRFDPARLLGPALIAGGALSWWALWIVLTVGPELGRGPVAIVVLATLGFFVPAAVLSAVSPLVTKLRLRALEETGTVVGSLSAWGTTGALFGVFVTGFVLVAAWPTRPIVLVLGACLVAAGVALVGWHSRRLPSAAVFVVVLASFAVGASSSSPCQFESAYFCGRVIDSPTDPNVRLLVLDDLTHAAVDTQDPTRLPIRYVRLLAAAVDARPAGPLAVAHVGGGGFTLPAHVSRTRPGSTNVVFEIDDVLLGVARDELGFVPDERTEVVIGDARLHLADLDTGSQDVVIGDAFTGAAVPWHLTTVEFVAEVARVLTPGGIYVMNVIDGDANDFVEWEIRTLADRFAHVAVIIPADGVGERAVNQILLASDTPIGEFEIGGDGRWVADVAEFAGTGRILTDDFAPVDRLLIDLN